jgi:NADH dehydrogenase
VIWVFIHLISIISFRNRIVVLLNWTWSYFTNDKGMRYILGKTREPIPAEATTSKAVV